MKSIATRFNLIGLASLMLLSLGVFQPPALTALANTASATQDRQSDPDRPLIVGQIPSNVTYPRLTIKQFLFPPADNKALRVQVANTGRAASGQVLIYLGTGETNNAADRKRTHVNKFSSLAAGASVWLVIDASSILPGNVSLQSTNFKLNVYSSEILARSGETEVRHAQLEFTAATPTTAARRRIVEGYSAEFYAGNRRESGRNGAVTDVKAKTTQPEQSRDSFYGTGIYKSTDAGRTWQVVGTCNTARGCEKLKDECKSLAKHSFESTVADGSLGMCLAQGPYFFLRNTNTAGAPLTEPPTKPADLSLAAPKQTSEATLNCHGTVMCKKAKNICAALGGSYRPIYDLSGSCQY